VLAAEAENTYVCACRTPRDAIETKLLQQQQQQQLSSSSGVPAGFAVGAKLPSNDSRPQAVPQFAIETCSAASWHLPHVSCTAMNVISTASDWQAHITTAALSSSNSVGSAATGVQRQRLPVYKEATLQHAGVH
jgi:hypothetical protein